MRDRILHFATGLCLDIVLLLGAGCTLQHPPQHAQTPVLLIDVADIGPYDLKSSWRGHLDLNAGKLLVTVLEPTGDRTKEFELDGQDIRNLHSLADDIATLNPPGVVGTRIVGGGIRTISILRGGKTTAVTMYSLRKLEMNEDTRRLVKFWIAIRSCFEDASVFDSRPYDLALLQE